MLVYLLTGIDRKYQRHVVVADLLPYDGCLPLAVIELSRGPPGVESVGETFSCVSVLWTSTQPEREAIKAHIEQVVKANILLSLRVGGSSLRGASSVPPIQPQTETHDLPALDENQFKYTKPLSDGTLPFKQTVLSSFANAPDDVQGQLKQFVDLHNSEVNQSGRPFKDNKRGADDTDEMQEEAMAASLEGQADVPQTKELLLEMFPHAEVLRGLNKLEIIMVKKGGTEQCFRKLN